MRSPLVMVSTPQSCADCVPGTSPAELASRAVISSGVTIAPVRSSLMQRPESTREYRVDAAAVSRECPARTPSMSHAGDTLTMTNADVQPLTTTRRRRILVVEDEGSIRELLRLHLSLAGFEVDEVGDGAAALDRARAERFDLIVLDLMLPGLDGITLCRATRTQGANVTTPIMM